MRNLYFVDGGAEEESNYVIASSMEEALLCWKQHVAEIQDQDDDYLATVEAEGVTLLEREDNLLVAPRSKV